MMYHLTMGKGAKERVIASGGYFPLADRMMREACKHLRAHRLGSKEIELELYYLSEALNIEGLRKSWDCPECRFYLAIWGCDQYCPFHKINPGEEQP